MRIRFQSDLALFRDLFATVFFEKYMLGVNLSCFLFIPNSWLFAWGSATPQIFAGKGGRFSDAIVSVSVNVFRMFPDLVELRPAIGEFHLDGEKQLQLFFLKKITPDSSDFFFRVAGQSLGYDVCSVAV